MKFDKKAIFEAVKEVLRLALFAGASAAVTWATAELTALNPTSTYVVAGTAVLRFVDKWLHEHKEIKVNGLAPF